MINFLENLLNKLRHFTDLIKIISAIGVLCRMLTLSPYIHVSSANFSRHSSEKSFFNLRSIVAFEIWTKDLRLMVQYFISASVVVAPQQN